MKPRTIIFLTAAAFASAVLFATAGAVGSRAMHQKHNAFNTKPTGKISPWAAMDIAAKKSGGKAFQALFEYDEGQWSYGVMVVKNHKLYEVEIDPQSGKVGDVEEASINGEAQEMKSDFAQAVKGG